MKKKYICLNESSKNFGKVIESSKKLPSSNYILLEALTSKDKKEIEEMVKAILKNMFWRMYTRSGYIVN